MDNTKQACLNFKLHCSAASQVLFHCSTPGLHKHQFRVLSFTDTTLLCQLPLARELTGSPDSRVESLHTRYNRSLTPPKPSVPCLNGTADVAFPILGRGLLSD